MNNEDDDIYWNEIGRLFSYTDDWEALEDPVSIELMCLDILEVELDRSRCRDAKQMLSAIGIKT